MNNEGEAPLLAHIRRKMRRCREVIDAGHSPFFVSQGWNSKNAEQTRWDPSQKCVDRECLKVSNPDVPHSRRGDRTQMTEEDFPGLRRVLIFRTQL